MRRLITPAGLFSPPPPVDRFLAQTAVNLLSHRVYTMYSNTQDAHFSSPLVHEGVGLGYTGKCNHAVRWWDPKHSKLTVKIIACTFLRGRTHLVD